MSSGGLRGQARSSRRSDALAAARLGPRATGLRTGAQNSKARAPPADPPSHVLSAAQRAGAQVVTAAHAAQPKVHHLRT